MSTKEAVSGPHKTPEKALEAQRKLDTQRKLEFITMVRRNMENRKMQDPSNGNFLPFPKEENPFKMGFGLEEIKLIKQEMEKMILTIGLKDVVSLRDTDEIMKLQQKIAEVEAERQNEGGFSLYGTKDEEGLHECNMDEYEDYEDLEQDDYDIGEIQGDPEFLYDYGPTHHIEVELSDGPAGEHRNRDDEPSCEFTFEYDRNGKLVPTYCNVEEQLRFMNLREKQGRVEAPVEETGKKKKKKSSKKKKKAAQAPQRSIDENTGCLFCQYEAFFGVKPVHMMRWYDQKVMNEERHRQKVREKLEKAKLRALRRQQPDYHEEVQDDAEDLDGSRTTVVDQGNEH
ncbi:hypothetical protein C7M61_003968 [Candidozyma pseudohaemuli]|uniref:Uncharacterized protein n=1 Tax=Candidozyma pseudohaemuli TaxID=418784 RepID=A0A2P7YKM8_9ASCO|nr:hypothetical protein C7M61_003968 [[Candida] pseudohaemulonii]PSK36495.1 hypothetical protein C7M61_003968 [[Candida] pseudohaemulonii]